MPNRLAQTQSPYLLQHKDNPVDWYPWGEEAFDKAQSEDKPIFLSIGYSTCHWCHVMEHESFEDEQVARLMNDTFVSIKVDREERPDIDSLYMTVCQLMNQRGGWPLNVILTPDKKPFYATTYVPKEGRFGRMGMLDLVPRIQELWAEQRDKVLQEAEKVTGTLQQIADQQSDGSSLDPDVLEEAAQQLADRFDEAYGGFGQAPKFPSPHNLLFLLRHARRSGDAQATAMVEQTLDWMRLGGVYDHVGYGFHRYSTDRQWLLPHFEKMLYDQAMLMMAYTEAYQVIGTPAYEQTVREIATYVLRDLRDPEGGFYSAEDADSEDASGAREEGAFYVWSLDELRDTLPEDLADLVIDVYDARESGNYEDESTRQRTGKNILHLNEPLHAIADDSGMDEATLRERWATARRLLFEQREQRPRPGLDDKVLTDWNGLMIAALAKAGRVFDAPDLTDAAKTAATFVLETLRTEDGSLLHRYRNGDVAIRAHLDDYAFLVWGLIELYETTFDARWLGEALCLTEEMIDQFWDEGRGGFFLSADDAEPLIVRQKELQDAAIPAGNSMALLNLIRLARLTGRTEYEDRADTLAQFAAPQVRSQPSAFTGLLLGLNMAFTDAREVVIAGAADAADTQALIEAVRGVYAPETAVLHRPERDDPLIATYAPFVEPHRPQNGQAAAYICEQFQCQAPTTDPEAVRVALEG